MQRLNSIYDFDITEHRASYQFKDNSKGSDFPKQTGPKQEGGEKNTMLEPVWIHSAGLLVHATEVICGNMRIK